MKKLLLFASACFMAFTASAQFVSLEVEEYAVHDGMVGTADLTGFTTYRLYVNLTNETDFVSSAFAEPDKHLRIETSTSFYQDPLGGTVGPDINPAFFPTFPSMEFDSWVTIGRENSTTPGGAINTVQSSTDPWIDDFSAGNNIVIDGLFGGAWFGLNGDVNGVAGPDLKVLLGQFTTDGDFGGIMTLQIFPEGVGANDEIVIEVPFSANPAAIFGCTDEEATNYDPEADTNDYSCIYPCALGIDTIETTSNLCSDGGNNASMVINAIGGQGATYFSLNGGNLQLSNTFGGLAGGVYDLFITDTQGCEFTTEVDLSNPDPIVIDAATEGISCFGANDAVLTANVTGGTGDLMYGLDPGDLSSDTPEFGDLGNGTFTIYAMDENGCTGSSEDVTISQPVELNINTVFTNDATCFNSVDGSLVITGTGGTGSYTYSADGENYSAMNMVAVAPGDYNAYVQDENGCVAMSDNVFTVAGGPEITFDYTSTDATCFDSVDGEVVLAGGGGNGGIMYAFDGGMAMATATYGELAAGTYDVQVVDSEGCTLDTQVEVMAPEAVAVEAVATAVACNGDENGMVELSATGGNDGEYTYSFGGGDFSTTTTYMDLDAGTYAVAAMDMMGCTTESEVTVAEPEVITVSAMGTDVLCNGDENGSIEITASAGGTGALLHSIDGENFETDLEFLDLAAGEYMVSAMDENGCMSEEVTVTVGEPDAITVDSDVTIDSGAGDGAIDITVAGGTGDYVIAWAGPDGFTSGDEDLTDLVGGDYTVTITDDNGCEYSETITLTVGIEEFFANMNVSVSPNPNNGEFVLNVEALQVERLVMKITDGLGRTVVEEQLAGQTNIRKDINIANEADGVYFLQLMANDQVRTIKIVKH